MWTRRNKIFEHKGRDVGENGRNIRERNGRERWKIKYPRTKVSMLFPQEGNK